MRQYLLLGLIALLGGCLYTKVHNLTLYNQFQLTKNEIRIDGYFYRQDSINVYSSSGLLERKTKISPIYFFADGTLGNYSQVLFEDNNEIEKFIKQKDRHILPEWGAYKISSDSIKIQTLKQVGNSSLRHEDVVLWEGIILNDTTFIIKRESIPGEYTYDKRKTESKNLVYRFQKSKIKVDSTDNWTKEKLTR
jgi:hypothetical protein